MYVFVNIYAAARNNKIEKSPELLIDLLSSALQRDAKKPVLKKKKIRPNKMFGVIIAMFTAVRAST